MIETVANGYSSESTQQELSNEYQHVRVWMFFKNLCVIVLWMKVASALKGLSDTVLAPPSSAPFQRRVIDGDLIMPSLSKSI